MRAGDDRSDRRLLALIVVTWLALGSSAAHLEREIRLPPGAGSPLGSLAQQARAAVAGHLWRQIETTMHAGVEMRTHREEDEHPHQERHHSDLTTTIPSAAADFRGLLGHLERQIRPYFTAQGHFHESPDKTIPLFRLMTWADPNFVPGYTVGANILCAAGRHVDDAIAFLHEGERFNPESVEIQTELGRYYVYYKRDYATGERHLRRALEVARHSVPRTQDEEQAVRDAYRWLVLTYQYGARYDDALATAREGRRLFGPDVIFDRILADPDGA